MNDKQRKAMFAKNGKTSTPKTRPAKAQSESVEVAKLARGRLEARYDRLVAANGPMSVDKPTFVATHLSKEAATIRLRERYGVRALPPSPTPQRIGERAKELSRNPHGKPSDLQIQQEAEYLALKGINDIGPENHHVIQARKQSIEAELREAVNARDLDRHVAPRKYDGNTFRQLSGHGHSTVEQHRIDAREGRPGRFEKMSNQGLVHEYLAVNAHDEYHLNINQDHVEADKATSASTKAAAAIEKELKGRGYTDAEMYRLRGVLLKESTALRLAHEAEMKREGV